MINNNAYQFPDGDTAKLTWLAAPGVGHGGTLCGRAVCAKVEGGAVDQRVGKWALGCATARFRCLPVERAAKTDELWLP